MESTYILLIMNCAKYAHKRDQQRATWLRELPPWVPYYHVVGRPNQHDEFIVDEEGRMLYVKAPDTYMALPQKVVAAFAALQADYIFKTDDDQMMVSPPAAFFKVLRTCIEAKRPNYGGFVVDIKSPHISQYYRIHKELPHDIVMRVGRYCNGRFYILSATAVAELIKHRAEFANEVFEDYAVGRYIPDTIKEPIMEIATLKNFHDAT